MRYGADCPKHQDCPLPGDKGAGLTKINSWLTEIATSPIRAEPDRPLNRPLAVNGIISSLYDEGEGWPQLRVALAAGFQGNGSFTALCGGEALPPELAESLLLRCGALWNMYGPTETTVWSFHAVDGRLLLGSGDRPGSDLDATGEGAHRVDVWSRARVGKPALCDVAGPGNSRPAPGDCLDVVAGDIGRDSV